MQRRLALLCAFLAGCSALPTARPGVVSEPIATPAGHLIRPAGIGPFPAVLLVRGDLGSAYAVQDSARRLADAGFLTFVPDQRDAEGLRTAFDYMTGRKDARPGPVGVIGLDSNAGAALTFATTEPRITAVVVSAGRLPTEPAPLKNLTAAVLVVAIEKDEANRTAFAAALEQAGKPAAGTHLAKGVPPDFLTGTSKGDEPAEKRTDAWQKITDHLRAALGRQP